MTPGAVAAHGVSRSPRVRLALARFIQCGPCLTPGAGRVSKAQRKRGEVRRKRELNERSRCTVSNCTKHRHGLSPYCQAHKVAARYYGHPEARKVQRKEYAGERREAGRFLQLHANHRAVIAATRFFDRWLRDAATMQPVPAAVDMRRLAAHGVTGAEMVEEVLSLWLYSRHNPRRLPDDVRLSKMLGTAVLRLAPLSAPEGGGRAKARSLGGSVRQEVGEFIRASLDVFPFHVFAALEQQRKTRQEDRQALRVPFAPCELAAPTTPTEDGETQT